MPNQVKVVVSVRRARCSAKSILCFGTFFFLAASLHFGVILYTTLESWAKASENVGHVGLPLLLWKIGHPTVFGIWSMVVGAVGMCASNPRRSRDKCLICTFGIFGLILIGFASYSIKEFRPVLERSIQDLKNDVCDTYNSNFYTNCYFRVTLYGCLILFAALLVLHSVLCVLCCLGSLILKPDVQPGAQDGEQQVPQPATSQDMMMQNQPPMYNPALQASTDNLAGNSPMPGPPINPAMQGNMQMQGNAPMPGPPINPAMQGNMQMQGNAPMPQPSVPPIYPTMQGNQGSIQGNAI